MSERSRSASKRRMEEDTAEGLASPAPAGTQSQSQPHNLADANDTGNSNEGQAINGTRRKSSWAFWTNEPDDTLQGATSGPPHEPTVDGVAASEEPAADPNASAPNSPIATVTINSTQHAVKPRSSSWSFWSAQATTPDAQRTMARAIVETDEPSGSSLGSPLGSPDMIKSHVSSSHKKPRLSISPSTNVVTPTVAETLPPYGARAALHSGLNYLRATLGYEVGESHLYSTSPRKFKRVLIIGVHGFFPTKMIRPLIGQPTGTSMRFAQVAETAVLEWARDNNMDIEIQKMALEKEGKILDRVDFYFELLKKAQQDIEQADFIFVCAHSQGTPVSIMLVAKLLEYGIISDQAVGILGMAGINMGPFYGMDKGLLMRAYSTIENASLLELFQFQNFESQHHRKYVECVRNLISHDVKLTFIGSIDDQLVPLYSSVASQVQHPNIFRAVYIDGTTNTPAFVARIVKLSCILQNLGHNDHGVIKEMSHALAGPITGGGHSKIYNDLQVYKTALDFTLKTGPLKAASRQQVRLRPFDIKRLGAAANPYNLPWCARGLFFEATHTLPQGRAEVDAVFSEFEHWSPKSKALEDVKYRLNGIRAKL